MPSFLGKSGVRCGIRSSALGVFFVCKVSLTSTDVLTSTKSYKGVTAVDGLLVSFYIGDSAGYDMKKDGV